MASSQLFAPIPSSRTKCQITSTWAAREEEGKMVELCAKGREEGGGREAKRPEREMGALSVERQSREWWLEESFGEEEQEERGNQETESSTWRATI